MKIIDGLAQKLGYVPKKDLERCRSLVKAQQGLKRQERQMHTKNIAQLADRLRGLVRAYQRDSIKPTDRYSIAVEIDYSTLRQIFDDFQIKNASVEYEHIFDGIFYEIRRNFDALLRLHKE